MNWVGVALELFKVCVLSGSGVGIILVGCNVLLGATAGMMVGASLTGLVGAIGGVLLAAGVITLAGAGVTDLAAGGLGVMVRTGKDVADGSKVGDCRYNWFTVDRLVLQIEIALSSAGLTVSAAIPRRFPSVVEYFERAVSTLGPSAFAR